MRAVTIEQTGGPEVLAVGDRPVPEPGPGEVRIRVEAAGVNFIDTYQRSGAYPLDLPAPLGLEAAGTVEVVGPGVEAVAAGDRVAHAGVRGAYAEQQVVSADRLVTVPDGVDATTAAAVMLQGMTAHYLTHDTWPLRSGEVALVHAAAGGVGHLLTQVCRLLGARVVGTCGSDDKAEVVSGLGADAVVVYTREDVVEAVREFTDGRGVDVVYDGVGRATFDDGLRCLRTRGMMVLYGQASGSVEPVDPQVLNQRGSLFLTRPILFHYVADRAELEARAGALFDWIAAGDLDVRVDRTFPIEDVAEAHRYLEGRHTRGKVLVVP